MSGVLRTNFRLPARDIEGLLGSVVVAGSFLPAAAGGVGGASALYGGYVQGSFASQLSGVGFLQISTLGALSAFWGTGGGGIFGGTGSGFKIIPFAMHHGSAGESNAYYFHLSATQALASTDSIFVIAVQRVLVSGGSIGSVQFIGLTSASNISVRFVWHGWIVSTP